MQSTSICIRLVLDGKIVGIDKNISSKCGLGKQSYKNANKDKMVPLISKCSSCHSSDSLLKHRILEQNIFCTNTCIQ